VIHHLALRVADLERARAFYSDLLGLPERRRLADERGLRAVWLQAGEALLMLERELRGRGAMSGSAHLLAFAVPDIAPWEEKLRAAGIAIDDRTPHTLFFRDPDGHRVGVSAYKEL
jgi:catechol 2,3-dioxygenase-like lactoylglutathione lyase family enzyme